jgi:hypothetical protein
MLIEDQPVIWQALAEYLTAQPEFNYLLVANSLEEFLRRLPAELAGPYSAANVYDPVSSCTLEVNTTNQPSMQLYIGNFWMAPPLGTLASPTGNTRLLPKTTALCRLT